MLLNFCSLHSALRYLLGKRSNLKNLAMLETFPTRVSLSRLFSKECFKCRHYHVCVPFNTSKSFRFFPFDMQEMHGDKEIVTKLLQAATHPR